MFIYVFQLNVDVEQLSFAFVFVDIFLRFIRKIQFHSQCFKNVFFKMFFFGMSKLRETQKVR